MDEKKHAPLVADPITRQEIQLEDIRQTLAEIAENVAAILAKLDDSQGA